MLRREIIAVCSEIHTKHINTLCGQNVEFLNVKPGGTYSDHWALEGYTARGTCFENLKKPGKKVRVCESVGRRSKMSEHLIRKRKLT
jgi:hypothetical protein